MHFQKKNSFVPNDHSLFDYVRAIRVYYRKTLKDRNAITDEDIRLVIFGDDELELKGDDKLKALAEMGFCFVPPHAKSLGSCGCRHCKRKHYR
jgi:glyoxylate utilization-related uncharacterized protein